MSDETNISKGKMAVSLIKEKSFNMISWEPVFSEIETKELTSLLYAIRNALSYANETKKLRGMVKAGFVFAVSDWNNKRKKINENILVVGDSVIKAANDYLKKNKIKVED